MLAKKKKTKKKNEHWPIISFGNRLRLISYNRLIIGFVLNLLIIIRKKSHRNVSKRLELVTRV